MTQSEENELVFKINEATQTLNQLIGTAVGEGFKVETNVLERQDIGNHHPTPMLAVDVYKKVSK